MFGKNYDLRRKRLSVSYSVRGLVGVMRVDCLQGNRLRSIVRLGYEPPAEWWLLDRPEAVSVEDEEDWEKQGNQDNERMDEPRK